MIYEYAKKYHDAGLSLVNLHPIENGKCGCGNPDCKMAGKHPQNSNWQIMIGLSNQFELIENYHNFNMLCTGFGWLLEDHHLVVDVDPKNGGFESFDKLCEKVPQLKECGVGVKTGGGGFHLYYNKPAELDVRGTHPDYPGIDFKHKGGFVVAGGSLHNSGKYYTIDHCYDDDLADLDDAPIELLAIIEKVVCTKVFEGDFEGDLSEVVSYIPNNDDHYDDFIEMGMAIHDTDPNAYPLWASWASKSSKFDEEEMLIKWESFGKNQSRVTIGTLIKKAIEHGYKLPAKGGTKVVIPEDYDPEDDLCTNHIDILKPHGLIGDIVRFINANAHRQRPAIAVLSALWGLGSVMGKMYIAPNGVRPNLITLSIAASGTGKNAPLGFARDILLSCGVGEALHGSISSAPEMNNNVVDHQHAFYAVDEVHRIFSASDDPRAPAYYKAVNDTLMTQYTDSRLVLRGNDAIALKSKISKSIAHLEASIEDAEKGLEFIVKTQIELEKKKMDYVKNGVPDPFMSFYGTSTPVNLDGLVTPGNIASGLVGRSIILKEYDNYPPATSYGLGSSMLKKELPNEIKERVKNIYLKGRAQDRTVTWREDYGLEFWGEPIIVGATDEAMALSSKIHAYFDSMGYKATSSAQPLYTRAFELVVKVAMIVASESGMMNKEDLMYAFALIKSDISTKIALLHVAEGDEKGSSSDDREKALLIRLAELCSTKGGLTRGQIKDRTKKKYKEEDVKAAISKLVDSGHIQKEEFVGGNNKKTIRYTTSKKLEF